MTMLSTVFDSILRYENQLLMRWEDDRSHLLAEVHRLQALHAKDIRTQQRLQHQYDELSELVERYQQSGTGPSGESKDLRNQDDEEVDLTQDLNSQDIYHAKDSISRLNIPLEPLPNSSKALPPKRKLTMDSENALNLLMPPSSIPKGHPLKKPRDASLSSKSSRDSGTLSKTSRSISLPPKLLIGQTRIEPPKMKSIEVVRKKDARDCLPGFSCSECERYYKELERQGLLDTIDRVEMLKRCSRHKSAWEPPQTPEGFWELSVNTPADWK